MVLVIWIHLKSINSLLNANQFILDKLRHATPQEWETEENFFLFKSNLIFIFETNNHSKMRSIMSLIPTLLNTQKTSRKDLVVIFSNSKTNHNPQISYKIFRVKKKLVASFNLIGSLRKVLQKQNHQFPHISIKVLLLQTC